MHSFPPDLRKNKRDLSWYKPKKKAKNWIVA
jgi:hypothetical protein